MKVLSDSSRHLLKSKKDDFSGVTTLFINIYIVHPQWQKGRGISDKVLLNKARKVQTVLILIRVRILFE